VPGLSGGLPGTGRHADPAPPRTPPPAPRPQEVCGSLQLPYQGAVLDFGAPFRRATMHDLVRDATGVDFEALAGDLEVRVFVCVRACVWGEAGRWLA
jgi:hypothetical protein